MAAKEIELMIERKDWVRALMAHPPLELNALAERLSLDCEVRHTSLPQAGLGLLTLADGAFREPYYLGEFPLSTCRIELQLADGRRTEGGAQVMADDANLARALAILDAVLAARLPGWEEVAERLRAGEEKCREQAIRRKAMLASTRVDFALLGTVDEEGDDEA
jgi:alpha-D-ribose 1-methylphosphonate 5-triphosphate synthase subunit PhnG